VIFYPTIVRFTTNGFWVNQNTLKSFKLGSGFVEEEEVDEKYVISAIVLILH
jgi:hypothetical protein